MGVRDNRRIGYPALPHTRVLARPCPEGPMSKKSLTETEICDRYITPALIAAGWDQATQVRREYSFTDG